MNTAGTASTTRINYIDLLKFIGLSSIIIAHVGSPDWLMMLRSFDVPLMVIISSILAERSFNKRNQPIIKYYISRIKRLVLPAWIFMIIIFIGDFILTRSFYSLEHYIYSFCFTRYGMSYVWVILIYLYSALLIPVYSKIKKSKLGLICIIAIYALYELAYFFKLGINNKFIDTTFYYIVPYGFLTYLGYNYSSIKKKSKYIILAVSGIIFVGLGIYYWVKTGAPQSVQIAKYPPRLYYLSYGTIISLLLLVFCEKFNFKFYNNNIIRYVSTHSMWLYLWHILVLQIYDIAKLPKTWYVKLVVVCAVALLIVLVTNKFLDIIEKKIKFKWLNLLRG